MSEPHSKNEDKRSQATWNDSLGDRVKTESTGIKREADTDTPLESKRPKYTEEVLALGGDALQEYDGKVTYDLKKHEPLPQHEVNSAQHKANISFHGQKLTQRLLRQLNEYQLRDHEFRNYYKNFSNQSKFAKPGAVRIGLSGVTGVGKSTLINVVNGEELSKASPGSKSITQVATVFCNAVRGENFQIFINFFHENTIKVMLTACVDEIMTFVKLPISERSSAEGKDFREDAVASLAVLRSLVPSLKAELNIREIEKHIQGNPMVGQDGDTFKLVDHLLELIAKRAKENGVDWSSRVKTETVQDAAEVSAKIKLFAEQNGLAAIVSDIVIRWRSALLAQGIELVDLPGHNDRNTHMSKAADLALDRCHKILVVVQIERCTSKEEVRAQLNDAIAKKTIGNVILVIRGREVVDGDDLENDPDATEEEACELTNLKERLEESTESGDEPEVLILEERLKLKKLEVRDQILKRTFTRDFEDPAGKKSLQVMTVSPMAYKQHAKLLKDDFKYMLSVNETNIPKLRALLCRLYGDAEVEKFIQHLLLDKKLAQQLLLCLDPDSLPSREAVLAVFNGQIKLSMRDETHKLQLSLDDVGSALRNIFNTTWQTHIDEKIQQYKTVAGGTIGACLRKSGTHKPKNKPIFRMNKEFTDCVPANMRSPLRSLHLAINVASSSAVEKTSGHTKDLKQRLENSDQMGGLDLPLISNLIDTEEKQCIRDIHKYNDVFSGDCEGSISKATADQVFNVAEGPSEYFKSMEKVFEGCLQQPKVKGLTLTHARLAFIQNALLSEGGPFSELSADILQRLRVACDKWSNSIEKRVNKMLNNLKKVLLNSFEGQKMSAVERREAAPAIRDAANQLISDVDRMLADYKPKQTNDDQDGLFVAP